MTRLEIFTDLGHLLERHKNRYYVHPVLIWKAQKLDITDDFTKPALCPVIAKLTAEEIRNGLSSTEWTKIVSQIQNFLERRK